MADPETDQSQEMPSTQGLDTVKGDTGEGTGTNFKAEEERQKVLAGAEE